MKADVLIEGQYVAKEPNEVPIADAPVAHAELYVAWYEDGTLAKDATDDRAPVSAAEHDVPAVAIIDAVSDGDGVDWSSRRRRRMSPIAPMASVTKVLEIAILMSGIILAVSRG